MNTLWTVPHYDGRVDLIVNKQNWMEKFTISIEPRDSSMAPTQWNGRIFRWTGRQVR